jgi:hypothetical protein
MACPFSMDPLILKGRFSFKSRRSTLGIWAEAGRERTVSAAIKIELIIIFLMKKFSFIVAV